MIVKPLIIKREQGLIRQVFDEKGAFILLPLEEVPFDVFFGNVGFPVVDIKERIGPLEFKQYSLYDKLSPIEEIIKEEIDKLALENPKVDEMNGIQILEADRKGVHIKIRGNAISRELETAKYNLVRYEITDRVLLKCLADGELYKEK